MLSRLAKRRVMRVSRISSGSFSPDSESNVQRKSSALNAAPVSSSCVRFSIIVVITSKYSSCAFLKRRCVPSSYTPQHVSISGEKYCKRLALSVRVQTGLNNLPEEILFKSNTASTNGCFSDKEDRSPLSTPVSIPIAIWQNICKAIHPDRSVHAGEEGDAYFQEI